MNQPHDPRQSAEFQEPQSWEPKLRPGPFAMAARLLLLLIIATLVLLPFTPFAGKIKRGIQDIVRSARETRERVVTREITKEVPRDVPRDVIREKEKVVEKIVEVPAPPPPLPDAFVPRKETDIASLFNGITIKTDLVTEQGGFASLERLDPEAYKVQFQVSVRVPKANQSVQELSRINPSLPAILPDLTAMVASAKVSAFYHKLYENKTAGVQRDITRLNRILDRHNFFDCETILELTHPATKRKALLVQSEMDVVCDGSDGDRMSTLDEYIYLSDYYQPFTSYAWAKKTKTPNPLLARWESRLAETKKEYAKKGLPAERNRELKSTIDLVTREIADMKARSSLIAEKDPFIVLSLLFRPYAAKVPHTPEMGDYAVVIHDKKIYPAICGDYGPMMKMGEASLFMAKAVNEKATPYRRPESDLKVTYLIFPGTAEKPFGPPDLAKWRLKCEEYLKNVGGLGDGFTLHTWDDPFKKPEPPPVAAAPGTPPAPTPGATQPPGAAPAPPTATTTPPPSPPPGAASGTALPGLPQPAETVAPATPAKLPPAKSPPAKANP